MSSPDRLPTLFIPHGGGPCFSMEPPPPLPKTTWDKLAAYLREAGSALAPRAKAILAVSGHWEAMRPTILAPTQHHLYFDYYNFPPHTYELRYPAKGAPLMAARVRELLTEAEIGFDENHERGLDHGVFIPFMLMFPEAEIPVVQLSLRADMDAAAHLAIGRALAPLRDEGILIVGTGMSYHNLRNFMVPGKPDADALAFDNWLTDTVADPVAANRDQKLVAWRNAPSALACHPEPEHLIPLHVVAGAALDDVGRRVFHDRMVGKAVSGFQFG